jgi:hypothetical protein
VAVSWFGSQNQADFDLSVAPQNRWREVSAGHASRSRDLLRVDASQARVFQRESFLRVVEFENALCNQDKLFCKIFCENKKLNLELESASSEIATL